MTGRATKERVWKRDRLRCKYCGVQLAMPPRGTTTDNPKYATIDHVVPLSRGGPNIRANMVTSCRPCNLRKGNGQLLDFRFAQAPEGAR